MKLKNLPDKEKSVNFAFRLKATQAARLQRYAEFESEQRSMDLSVPEITTSIVESFLDDAKEFERWLKDQSKTKKPKPAEPEKNETPSTGASRSGLFRP